MKNKYMLVQCRNMIATIAAFTQACELAALIDDGLVSKAEERDLRQIKEAAEKFQGQLNKVMNSGRL